jgi:hypothetical protein
MAVVVGAIVLPPADLLAARNRFWELEADDNVESAGLIILERHTMVRAQACRAFRAPARLA